MRRLPGRQGGGKCGSVERFDKPVSGRIRGVSRPRLVVAAQQWPIGKSGHYLVHAFSMPARPESGSSGLRGLIICLARGPGLDSVSTATRAGFDQRGPGQGNEGIDERASDQRSPHLRVACSNCNLRELCLPVGLSTEGRRAARRTGRAAQRVKRGDALFRAGDRFESLYAVRLGFLKSTVMSQDGREQVTGFHMAGELVGLDGISTEAHTCDTVALEDTRSLRDSLRPAGGASPPPCRCCATTFTRS